MTFYEIVERKRFLSWLREGTEIHERKLYTEVIKALHLAKRTRREAEMLSPHIGFLTVFLTHLVTFAEASSESLRAIRMPPLFAWWRRSTSLRRRGGCASLLGGDEERNAEKRVLAPRVAVWLNFTRGRPGRRGRRCRGRNAPRRTAAAA